MFQARDAQIEDYEPLHSLKAGNSVQLVRHRRDSGIFVMKIRYIYDLDVYRYLASNPHPGLPRIIDCFEKNDKLVVIEEYISGSTLDKILEERGVLEPGEAVRLLRRLCEILIPLHRHNPPIVHRDIKPSNIIVSYDGNVTLIDFNSAKISYENQSRDTELVGTSGYAAPEQYGFSVSKPSTDVFALGVILNELLTGHTPVRHRENGFLKPLIERCRKMESAERYRDAGELMEALDSLVLKKKPMLGLPDDWRAWLLPGYRCFKPLRWVLATIGYYLLIAVCWSITSLSDSFIEMLLTRFWLLASTLSQVLYWGDYRLWRSRLPGTRQKNAFLRHIVIIAYSFALVLALLILFALLIGIYF